jgi:hypothetical protein
MRKYHKCLFVANITFAIGYAIFAARDYICANWLAYTFDMVIVAINTYAATSYYLIEKEVRSLNEENEEIHSGRG